MTDCERPFERTAKSSNSLNETHKLTAVKPDGPCILTPRAPEMKDRVDGALTERFSN
jgi:hypothetical protein